MIEKKIHYCWFGGKPLPEKDKKCIESWKKFCPEYEIIRHDETNYDITKNKYMNDAYLNKKWGFVPDYARLDIIYNEGGIYLDTDVELTKSLDDLLQLDAYMGFEDGLHVSPGLGFGAKKHHEGIKKIMEIYSNLSFYDEAGNLNLTPSPQMNTEILIKNGLKQNGKMQKVLDITILPTDYLCPKSYETGDINITENTYSIHHFNMSWVNEEDKKRYYLTIKMKKVFGNKLGKKMSKIVWFSCHPKLFVIKIFKKLGIKK